MEIVPGFPVRRKIVLAAGFFKIWMVPPVMVFVAGWIFLGGYLFQKSLLKYSGERRVKYGTGVLTSFLCGLVGGLPAFAALWISFQKEEGGTITRFAFLAGGIVVGVISFAVIGYLVVFTMFKKLSAKTAFSVSLTPLVVIIALGGAVGVSCGIPVVYQKRKETRINKHIYQTLVKLEKIHDVLFRKYVTDPPETLDILIEQEVLTRDDLISPAKPDGKGFFYYPPFKILHQPGENTDELLACDYSENYDGEYYVVIYTYGRAIRLGEHAFNSVLDRPINKEFAEAFRKADSK